MTKTIWFDMDGTIANLYAVEGWLADLRAERTRPYDEAAPMLRMATLARLLNRLQREGWKIGIISWLSKCGTDLYDGQVTLAKMLWLHKHLPSVSWDTIHIVKYGTNKYNVCGGGILFDDEAHNRETWGDLAYEPDQILQVLRNL